MRIVVIRRRYDPFGGAEKYLGRLSRSLIDHGHEVRIVTESWPGGGRGGVETSHKETGSDVVSLRPGRGPAFVKLRFFARAASNWLAQNKDQYDVALTMERVPGAQVFRAGDGVHRAWLDEREKYASGPRRLSFKLNPLHKAHLALEKQMLHHAGLEFVVANSSRVAEELTTYYGLDQAKIRLVPTGVDLENLRVGDPERVNLEVRSELAVGGAPMLLFVGSGFERKGLAFALGALTRMRRHDAVLAVAGKDFFGKWQKMARRLGVDKRVRFLGSRDDVPRLLAAADAFVLPTIYDPQSNACLEALAVGVPVVTTMANGAVDFVLPGRSGCLVDRADHLLRLAQAIDDSLEIGEFRAEVPTQEEHIKGLLDVLKEAAT